MMLRIEGLRVAVKDREVLKATPLGRWSGRCGATEGYTACLRPAFPGAPLNPAHARRGSAPADLCDNRCVRRLGRPARPAISLIPLTLVEPGSGNRPLHPHRISKPGWRRCRRPARRGEPLPVGGRARGAVPPLSAREPDRRASRDGDGVEVGVGGGGLHGVGDGSEHTLEEVGQNFAVTRERIRQIEAKALRKLRHPTRSRHLRDYLG